MKKRLFKGAALLILAAGITAVAPQQSCAQTQKASTTGSTASKAGLKLPAGFSATVVAPNVGSARHLAVTKQGDIYVKLQSTNNDKQGIVMINPTGDVTKGFGDYGGTGMAIKNGYLYASSNTDVYRYKLDDNGNVIDPSNPEHIISNLKMGSEHESKSIALDNDGNIYVNVGAYSNSCQEQDRARGSMGMNPCPVLNDGAGIWMFKADKLNQTQTDGVHYATGLRNVVGLDWNTTTNTLFVMQHGRDQLHDIFPDMYTTEQSANLPAECMYELHKGDNAGWPYSYYDPFMKKIVQAPEYGGDGKKAPDQKYLEPTMAFPAHMAPDGLLFYTGNMFPEKYKNGAFIAFHGSWNRAPEPQKGAFVAFVPFKDGKPSGNWEIFAEGFAGPAGYTSPGKAKHRPCGLAQGPDGALYVSDDQGGTIYKIVYKGK